MELWLLKPIENHPKYKKICGYNCNYGFVIRAKSESIARSIATKISEDENYDPQYFANKNEVCKNSKMTSCVKLTSSGEEKLIITDFNAG